MQGYDSPNYSPRRKRADTPSAPPYPSALGEQVFRALDTRPVPPPPERRYATNNAANELLRRLFESNLTPPLTVVTPDVGDQNAYSLGGPYEDSLDPLMRLMVDRALFNPLDHLTRQRIL